jgi:cytochrome c551/c552
LNTRKATFLTSIIIAGALLVYVVYRPELSKAARPGSVNETAPALSAHPFHQAFVSEEACLACHAQERDLPAFGLVAPRIAHEVRKECDSCHQLPT